MENKKKTNLFVELLKYSLIPYVVLGIKTKRKTGSTIKGIAIGFACWVIIGMAWGFFWADSSEKVDTSSQSSQIFELNNEILEANKVIDLKEKEIKKLKEKEVKKEVKEVKAKTTEKVSKIKNKDYEFSSGNFVSGEDFEPGKYNIIAVKGSSGNVISSNMFDGGINAIMGINSEYAEKEYKNINLPKNTRLEIKGITVKLVKK